MICCHAKLMVRWEVHVCFPISGCFLRKKDNIKTNTPLQHVPHLWLVEKNCQETLKKYNLYSHEMVRTFHADPSPWGISGSHDVSTPSGEGKLFFGMPFNWRIFYLPKLRGLGRIIGSDKDWSSLGLELETINRTVLGVVLVDLQKWADTSHMIWR